MSAENIMSVNESAEDHVVGKVVIVDDNPENLRTLKAMLDSQGYETFAAINGALALVAAKQVQPDVILLDIMMPDMNGYEVCKQLKADEATQHIPVLFISALDEAMDKVKAFDVGGVDYISKPFQAEEALARVKTHVSLSRTQKKLTQAYAQLQEHSNQLSATNKELESFSYSVSHDLRSPLRSISGFSSILREDFDDVLNDEGKNYLHKIESGALKMQDLIDDILKLSRISRQEFMRTEVDLSELSQVIAQRLENDFPDANIQIKIASGLMALCDKGLVGIALTNLMTNAWKFSATTRNPVIEVTSKTEDGKEVFIVKDNGIGFDMRYAAKLFQPFQRLNQIEGIEGTGIGLATVQRVINMHGGKIWVEAAVDEGATFYFTLS